MASPPPDQKAGLPAVSRKVGWFLSLSICLTLLLYVVGNVSRALSMSLTKFFFLPALVCAGVANALLPLYCTLIMIQFTKERPRKRLWPLIGFWVATLLLWGVAVLATPYLVKEFVRLSGL